MLAATGNNDLLRIIAQSIFQFELRAGGVQACRQQGVFGKAIGRARAAAAIDVFGGVKIQFHLPRGQ